MTQKQTLLALTSVRGRSGKDTLIESLERRGHVVHRVAFADILKEQAAKDLASFDFTEADLLGFFHSNAKDEIMPGLAIKYLPEGPYKKWLMFEAARDPVQHRWMIMARTPRWHLQKYGTEFKREYLGNPNVWLNAGLDAIRKAPEGTIVVVSDLRLVNEYIGLANLITEERFSFHPVRIQRLWFVPGVDDVDYHKSDLDLIGHFMWAVVLNEWGKPDEMVDQLIAQGVSL